MLVYGYLQCWFSNFQENIFNTFLGTIAIYVIFLENLAKRFSRFLIFNCLLKPTKYFTVCMNLNFPVVRYIRATEIHSNHTMTCNSFIHNNHASMQGCFNTQSVWNHSVKRSIKKSVCRNTAKIPNFNTLVL